MVISKYITMRDYNRTLWFLLIAIMFLSVVGDYPCQALGIWAMLFAGYGIGIPSIDKRYVIMSTCLYLVSMICPYCGEIIVEPNKEAYSDYCRVSYHLFVEGIREYKYKTWCACTCYVKSVFPHLFHTRVFPHYIQGWLMYNYK